MSALERLRKWYEKMYLGNPFYSAQRKELVDIIRQMEAENEEARLSRENG